MNQLTSSKYFSRTSFIKYAKTSCVFILTLLLILGWSYLGFIPWETGIYFNQPRMAVKNNNGIIAVIDGKYDRCTLMNTDGIYLTSLKTDVSPSLKHIAIFKDICLSSDRLFVLDHISSTGSMKRQAVRILSFDLRGHYTGTVFKHELNDTDPFSLSSIHFYGGHLYCTQIDGAQMTVYRLEGNQLQKIASWNPCDKQLWEGGFAPAHHKMWAIANDGTFHINSGNRNTTKQIILPGTNQHAIHAAFRDSGELYVLDGNQRTVFQIDMLGNITKKFINDGTSITCSGDEMLCCDTTENQCTSYNLKTNSSHVYKAAQYSFSHMLICCFIWMDAAFLGILLFIFLIRNILNFFRTWQQRQQQAGISDDSEFTITALYARPTFFLTIAIIAVALFILSSYFQDLIAAQKNTTEQLASQLSHSSSISLGNLLEKINSSADYNSPEYKALKKIFLADKSDKPQGLLNSAVFLIRFKENGDSMLVLESYDVEYLGLILDSKRGLGKLMAEHLDKNRLGEPSSLDETEQTDHGEYYYSFAPVFNSEHRPVGSVVLFYNKNWAISSAMGRVFIQGVNLLLFFVLVVFFYGEGKLAWAFLKKHWKIKSAGLKDKTIIEVHRTLRFLDGMSNNVHIPFFVVLVMEIAQKNGITENLAVFSALPLTLAAVIKSVTMSIFAFHTKRTPRLYYSIGAVSRNLISSGIWIFAIICNSMPLFFVGAIAYGIGLGLTGSAADAIRATGIPAEPRFKHLVFVNVEYSLGYSMACVAGAFIAQSLGYISAYVFVIILGIIQLGMIAALLKSDINIPHRHLQTDTIRKNNTIRTIRTYLAYFARPKFIFYVLCIMTPIAASDTIADYVFPLFNADQGYSVLISGIVMTATTIISTVLLTGYLSLKPSYGEKKSIYVGKLCFAGAFLLFSIKASIFPMLILLVASSVFVSIARTNLSRVFVAEANQHHLSYNAIASALSIFEELLYSITPIILGFILTKGYSQLGLICGIATLLLLFLFIAGSVFDKYRTKKQIQ